MSGFLSLAGEGSALNALGIPLKLRAGGADTGGALDVIEVEFAPGVAFPAHRHHNSDEAFFVLAGELTARLGDASRTVAAGSFALAPRGTVHGFENSGSEPATVLAWQWPSADVAGFVAALGEMPPGEPDMEQVLAIMQRFDIEPAD